MNTLTKLQILADAAKYDAACTSSGITRSARKGSVGNASAAGCCHSFTPDGRCVTLLKVLMTNACSYDCAYCVNRRSNVRPRATFEPRELAQLTIDFYKRNYIEGLFLSSGVLGTPDATTERMIACLTILRRDFRFRGYIHAKAIPGTDMELLDELGRLADRLSVNIELPTSSSLGLLCPQKGASSILEPMHHIAQVLSHERLLGRVGDRSQQAGSRQSRMRQETSHVYGADTRGVEGLFGALPAGDSHRVLTGDGGRLLSGADASPALEGKGVSGTEGALVRVGDGAPGGGLLQAAPKIPVREEAPLAQGAEDALAEKVYEPRAKRKGNTYDLGSYVPAGQSTQLIIGATPENDNHILKLSSALYTTFGLKRVFFSAYMPVVEDARLPHPETAVPLRREHRLYQADWLMRFYSFSADELVSPEAPYLDLDVDPKLAWALCHMERFPVEVNTATLQELLRVPGIGPVGARKILRARKSHTLTFDDLARLKLTLRRARHFLTCAGKRDHLSPANPELIRKQVIEDAQSSRYNRTQRLAENQPSLF